jgi:hypothetical protein
MKGLVRDSNSPLLCIKLLINNFMHMYLDTNHNQIKLQQKSPNPTAHMSVKLGPRSASPGARTLDTLIKRDGRIMPENIT